MLLINIININDLNLGNIIMDEISYRNISSYNATCKSFTYYF